MKVAWADLVKIMAHHACQVVHCWHAWRRKHTLYQATPVGCSLHIIGTDGLISWGRPRLNHN